MTPRSLLSAGAVTETLFENCSAAETRSRWLTGVSGAEAAAGARAGRAGPGGHRAGKEGGDQQRSEGEDAIRARVHVHLQGADAGVTESRVGSASARAPKAAAARRLRGAWRRSPAAG